MQDLQMSHNEYEPRDYRDILDLEGFSQELLEDHVGLYAGYVTNTNKAHRLLRTGDLNEYERAEVRRRMVWEFNGMRLHELYFDGLTPGGKDMDADGPLATAIKEDFGDLAAWGDDFRSTGAMRGIGWAALSYDPVQDRFFDHWVNEHDAGALAGTVPLLVMDVFEHAFIKDFGTDRGSYMDAFFANVDWRVVERRFADAT